VRLSKLARDGRGWETRTETIHYADQHLEVVTEDVKTPSHEQEKNWTIVYRKPAVVVAAMTRAGEFLMVQQERVPIRAAIWEMPAGQIDSSSEPDRKQIEETALRELQEETGYQLAEGGELIPLGEFFSSPGFTDERGHLFVARPVERHSGVERDEAESILDCRAFTPAEIRRMIRANEIRDANTLSICARLSAHGLLSLSPD
jgi:ADP-ribose pyrophosphatase